MRRIRTTLAGRLGSGRSRLNLVFALLLAVGVAGLVGDVAGTAPAAPIERPALSYTGTWTLADLVRHADAGEVLVLTSAAVPSGAPVADARQPQLVPGLAAKTREGQWMSVVLSQTPAEAETALRALGYGRLLSAQAQADFISAAGRSAPASPFTVPLALAVMIAVAALLMVNAPGRAKPGGARWGSDGSRTFRTIVPGRPEQEPGAVVAFAPAVTFDDVAGCDEAKAELAEVVEFLRDPSRFTRLGARIPRGVLLYGPPGGGKTLLARACASSAGVAFTYASGSEFVEKFVGVGAKRVRGLFAQARAAGKGVIFIDEIDALARARGGGGEGGGHIEADQTLNALLTEMDGFTTTDDVIVLAATNRLDTLDPAILRPGRFTRKINVPQPDQEARAAILTVHARNKPLDASIDLGALARRTGGFSGAMLADLLNEAAIFAARRDAATISRADIDEGWAKVAVGVGRKRSMPPRERTIIAAHEAGHAICGRIHTTSSTIEKISLYRHGDALGYTASNPGDELLPDESALRANVIALMGGRAAESLLFREVTAGASDDLEKANRLAIAMVKRLGLGADPGSTGGATGRGRLGYLVTDERGGGLHGEQADVAARAIHAILDDAYATALDTLRANLDLLHRVGAYLVETEGMSGEEFAAICEGRLEPTPAALATWLVPEAKPRSLGEVSGVRPAAAPGLLHSARPAAPAAPRPDGPSPARATRPGWSLSSRIARSLRPAGAPVRAVASATLRAAAARIEELRPEAGSPVQD